MIKLRYKLSRKNCWLQFCLFICFLPVKTVLAFQPLQQKVQSVLVYPQVIGSAYVMKVKTRAVDASDSVNKAKFPVAFAGDIIQIKISNPTALLQIVHSTKAN